MWQRRIRSSGGWRFSWLSGRFGASCDNLISARIITENADTLNANADTNQDLFWAIRGGGGNFGVATSFEYKLHPVRGEGILEYISKYQ